MDCGRSRRAAARTLYRKPARWRGAPPAATILPMTPFFLSDRDRLLLAFANLASYGIAAREAYGDSATEAHAAVAADLRLRFPHGPAATCSGPAPTTPAPSTPTAA